MAATTTTRRAGFELRRARERLGLTRAQLATLAGCSLASLGNIEAGAVPRRSRVLARAWEAIDRMGERSGDASQNDADPSGGRVGVTKKADRDGQRGTQ